MTINNSQTEVLNCGNKTGEDIQLSTQTLRLLQSKTQDELNALTSESGLLNINDSGFSYVNINEETSNENKTQLSNEDIKSIFTNDDLNIKIPEKIKQIVDDFKKMERQTFQVTDRGDKFTLSYSDKENPDTILFINGGESNHRTHIICGTSVLYVCDIEMHGRDIVVGQFLTKYYQSKDNISLENETNNSSGLSWM